MKITTRLGVALALLAGLTLVGAPSAHAADEPGSSPANPIYIQPVQWQQIDDCGTANDKLVRVPGYSSKQASFVSAWQNGHTQLIATSQTGPIGGVYYAYEGVTPPWWSPNTYTYQETFTFSAEPCYILIAKAEYAPQVVGGELVVPDVEGVNYTVIDQGTYWRIEATPKPGYILLAEGLPVVWERAKP